MKVAIVTPTIGSTHLRRCIGSVENQTYKDIVHYIFVDGEDSFLAADQLIPNNDNIKTVKLQQNVGKGWYGHRVYAACSFLVDADIICYLDEDNFLEENHVQDIVDTISKGNDWAYSLRNIYNKDGEYLCEDNCESLGKWPVHFNDQTFHIDTSCFGVKRDVAVRIGHAWYGKWGADRQFFTAMKQYFPKFDCTGNATLNYRLDGNPNSVTLEFFEEGNKVTQERFGGDFPWKKRPVSGEFLGPGIRLIP